ncbi:MAG: o-succinylbenzoate synthase [Solirubrobacterales bacterium]|nr:o-succinylbenzoate synthase [Solirubrobacterales bacterium]
MKLTVERREIGLREPHAAAHGELRSRELFAVTLEGEDGLVGHGEAAPLEPYDGIPGDLVAAALRAHAEAIARLPGGATGPQVLDACRNAADLPQALAAVDLALWDRGARRAGKPVAALLTDDPDATVEVNATIGALDRGGAADAAAQAARAGFRCVKVKVGVGDDAGRVAAVRALIGPEVALRLDANGAWTVDEAVAAIEALSPAGLELVEEPVHGIEALRAVRERVAVRIAMDETAAEHGALASGAADAVCLKISRCGGISATLAAASLVRALGGDVYLASTLDGPLGIAAALHCAAALKVDLPCGLATLRQLELDGDPLPVLDGRIAVPTGPGLLG